MKRLYLLLLPLGAALSPAAAHAQSATPDGMTNITVEQSVIDTVSRALPERRQVGAHFLDQIYDPNIRFESDAQASVTFLTEGAGYRNSLGYFNYDLNTFDNLSFGDIDTDGSGVISTQEVAALDGVRDIGIVFGNASGSGGYAGWGGSLRTGDTTVLGGGTYTDTEESWSISDGTTFEAGTGLGFFVIANGWTGRDVAGWDDNNSSRNTFWTVDMLNQENNSNATIDNVSGVSRHVAMLDVEGQNQLLLGFEDLVRPGGDNDFNDAVFMIRTTPEASYDKTNLPSVSPAPSPSVGVVALLFAVAGISIARRRPRKA